MRTQAENGTVYLVGAGPGDPDLITRRGLSLIRQADVLVYDRLVHPDLIEEAGPDAERIYVGKAPGLHSCPQELIHDFLVDRALRGAVVVRLKGGDPFVLGRGGEEGIALRRAGIPFEIVPGITSAISVPAYAGIPVTHRGVATSFAVVTGHTCGDGSGEPDWNALANLDTLVILMGLGRLARIAERLIESGRAPETPVAVIRCGTTENQVVVESTLARIGEAAAHLRSPATVVIGEVVRLRRELDWFSPAGRRHAAPHRPNHSSPFAHPAERA
jgi:uroporphyrin-III C-methyltransferase